MNLGFDAQLLCFQPLADQKLTEALSLLNFIVKNAEAR